MCMCVQYACACMCVCYFPANYHISQTDSDCQGPTSQSEWLHIAGLEVVAMVTRGPVCMAADGRVMDYSNGMEREGGEGNIVRSEG